MVKNWAIFANLGQKSVSQKLLACLENSYAVKVFCCHEIYTTIHVLIRPKRNRDY